MCTVTLVAGRNGYALGMNRDEKLTRVAALPPARHRVGSRGALFPSEPGGGTWIGVNDAGITLALINWYAVTARVTRQAISRGEVVKLALPSDSPARVDAALAAAPLMRVNPFRLIGVFPSSQSVVEWRWSLDRLERLPHPWQYNTWISSGFDEPGAQRIRGAHFLQALNQSSAGSVAWLRRLHRSHTPERGPYSTCMHRADAATVSYTEVIVVPPMARMRYLSGAPCCGTPHGSSRLAFGPTGPLHPLAGEEVGDTRVEMPANQAVEMGRGNSHALRHEYPMFDSRDGVILPSGPVNAEIDRQLRSPEATVIRFTRAAARG